MKRLAFALVIFFQMSSLSAQQDNAALESLQPELAAMIQGLAQQPKDPNLEKELQHILYWMGGQQRCYVKRGSRVISVLGMMVMIEKAYEQFKPIIPNIESLFMLASMPRNPYQKGLGGADSNPQAEEILFYCRKQEPQPIMAWVMPEVERFRKKQG